MQVLVEGKPGQTGDELERELFILRKLVEKAKAAQLPAEVASDFYICTLSSRTIVYKVQEGARELLLLPHLAFFYLAAWCRHRACCAPW